MIEPLRQNYVLAHGKLAQVFSRNMYVRPKATFAPQTSASLGMIKWVELGDPGKDSECQNVSRLEAIIKTGHIFPDFTCLFMKADREDTVWIEKA